MQDTVYQPGHIRCQLPMYPAGSYNISAANKYGLATNSLRKKYDSRGRAYDLQYYGDITNIEPTVGGLNGGTVGTHELHGVLVSSFGDDAELRRNLKEHLNIPLILAARARGRAG